MNRRSTVLAASGVAALAVAAGLIWYLGGDAPDAVDLDQAVAGLADTSTDPDGDTEGASGDDGEVDGTDTGAADDATGTDDRDPAATAAGGGDGATLDGTWGVDSTVESFDVDVTAGTFVGFRVDEELSGVGATTAIGRTPEVTGSVTLDDTQITAASFEADLTALVSDRPQRDSRVQGALDTASNPTTTLTLTDPVDLDAAPAAGETITTTATAELTVNATTREVQVPLEAIVADGVLVVTGSFDILLSDYGVTAPSAPIVLSVSDTATIELQLLLSPR